MSDAIERTIFLAASIDRVWRAISDHREFGTWFRVALDQPFAAGETSSGRMTYPGYEHLPWEATIVAVEPQRRLAFRWVPNAVDPAIDYADHPTTLVEFLLEPTEGGTRVTVIESGFDSLPPADRADAMRSNEGGWTEQMENIRRHVEG